MSKIFFSSDIVEFLFLLHKHKVKYVIVGGEAVIYYGHARLTGDIDIFMTEKKKIVQSSSKL
jgi:predicted nucleotidyltransferase